MFDVQQIRRVRSFLLCEFEGNVKAKNLKNVIVPDAAEHHEIQEHTFII